MTAVRLRPDADILAAILVELAEPGLYEVVQSTSGYLCCVGGFCRILQRELALDSGEVERYLCSGHIDIAIHCGKNSVNNLVVGKACLSRLIDV